MLLPETSLDFSQEYAAYTLIAGVDEVGRGALCGPVVAAAVILNVHNIPKGIDDSKRLTAVRREAVYPYIMETAVAIGIGIIEPEVIDKVNIFHASYQAMAVAVSQLAVIPNFVMVDGNRTIPHVTIPQQAIVKGDGCVLCIAAASIVAKVTRDRLMVAYHAHYPEYSLCQHKGYATVRHYLALEAYGPSPIHRLSFRLSKQKKGASI